MGARKRLILVDLDSGETEYAEGVVTRRAADCLLGGDVQEELTFRCDGWLSRLPTALNEGDDVLETVDAYERGRRMVAEQEHGQPRVVGFAPAEQEDPIGEATAAMVRRMR